MIEDLISLHKEIRTETVTELIPHYERIKEFVIMGQSLGRIPQGDPHRYTMERLKVWAKAYYKNKA